ncbi:hypothetical protein C8J56DRAFT_1170974 [Mycena floridula]|nr:hypothetical protein C8J56DRAFT_1170974 [Mycena floridula]
MESNIGYSSSIRTSHSLSSCTETDDSMSPSPSFSLPSSAKPFEAHRTRLLQSNNRPEPHEIAFFVDDLSDQQRRLDDLEEEFKAEYRLLKIRFTERKKHIKQVIQDNKSIISAIQRSMHPFFPFDAGIYDLEISSGVENLERAFSTACASLQSLESIYVYVSGSCTADEIQKSSIQHLFRFAPRLNSIGTWMGNPQVLPHCDLPWSQITHYHELHAFTPLERPHFQILPSMAQLQYCQIDSQAIHVASHPVTELPQLVRLVLLGTHGIQILSKLLLPNLISLSSDISDDCLPDLPNLLSQLPSL